MRISAIAAMLVLVSGCASTKQYCVNRGADLIDVFRANVFYGVGIGADAFATTALKLGAMGENTKHIGLDGHGVGIWGQGRGDGHLLLIGHEWGHRKRPYLGSVHCAGLGAGGERWLSPLLGGRQVAGHMEHACGPLEFGARVGLFFLGAEAGLRVSELVDFAVGLVGFDPKRDDGRTP